ncbi:hypothetical protein [Phocaeicola sp.]
MEQCHQEAGKEKQYKPSERNYLSLVISFGYMLRRGIGTMGLR